MNASPMRPCNVAYAARVIPQPGQSKPVAVLKKQPGIQPSPRVSRSIQAAIAKQRTASETQIARSLCKKLSVRDYPKLQQQ